MQTIPTDVKRETIISFLKPTQRVSLALTNKKEFKWMRPILQFMNMSFDEKIVYLKTTPQLKIPNDIIMEAVEAQHNPQILISLLRDLPNTILKKKVRQLIEDRIRDRNYRKFIKKTLLQMYLQHLVEEGKSVSKFINTIQSPQVRSFAIEQYVLMHKKEISPATLKKWVEKIPDEYTRNKTARTLRLV